MTPNNLNNLNTFKKRTHHLQENVNEALVFLVFKYFPILLCHPSVSDLSLVLYAMVYRLEFQHGVSIPVSQLEGVCGRLCPALCMCCGGTYLHAWESQVLPWGNGIFLYYYYSSTHIHTDSVLISFRITTLLRGAVSLSQTVHAYQFYIQYLYNNTSGKLKVLGHFPTNV